MVGFMLEGLYHLQQIIRELQVIHPLQILERELSDVTIKELGIEQLLQIG